MGSRLGRLIGGVLLVALTLGAVACGLLHQREPGEHVVSLEAGLSGCTMPEGKDLLDAHKVSREMVVQALDCIDQTTRSAFGQVRGATAGELSIGELKMLQKKGLLKVDVESEDTWNLISGLLTFFHPDGRPALSEAEVAKVVAWARPHAELFVRAVQGAASDQSLLQVFSPLVDEAVEAFDGFTDLISENGKLSLAQALLIPEALPEAKALKDVIQVDDGLPPETAGKKKVRALWNLRSLALESDAIDDLTSVSVKRLLKASVLSLKSARQTINWMLGGFHPQEVPADMPQEWGKVADILGAYVSSHYFSAVSSDQLRWAYHQLAPDGTLGELMPDLVRISQKLNPPDRRYEGLHPSALVVLLHQLPGLAEDFVRSAGAFGNCESYAHCEVPIRKVYRDHPRLKLIALKGHLNWQAITEQKQVAMPSSRLDLPLDWEEAMNRFLQRALLTKIFEAFDDSGTGRIPYIGSKSQDLSSAVDLATTFIRFISLSNLHSDEKSKLEPVPAPVLINPDSLVRVMGLVGDRWMLDGNDDGALNAEEFFSIIKIYEEIQTFAQTLIWNTGIKEYSSDPDTVPWLSAKGPIYGRHDFIQNIIHGAQYTSPLMYQSMMDVGSETRNSLFHALVPIPDLPIVAWDTTDPNAKPGPLRLTDYVKSSAALAPAAIMTMVDRLMIRCDANEDGELDWKEMDCAAPLLLDAALQTITSNLIDLDPIVHDGSILALRYLQRPGLPLSIAKLMFINGAAREDRLDPQLTQAVHPLTMWNWIRTGFFYRTAREPDAQLKYQSWQVDEQNGLKACDTDHDGRLTGAELDCLADRVLAEVSDYIGKQGAGVIGQNEAESVAQKIKDSSWVRNAIKAAAHNLPTTLEVLSDNPGARTSPEKIFRLLEEVIRRGVPFE